MNEDNKKENDACSEESTIDNNENVETAEYNYNELNDKYIRLQAEFQNYKKRTEKEKIDIIKYGKESVFTELLEVIDNFERATAHEDNHEAYISGTKHVYTQLYEILKKNGLESIEAVGQEFDPTLHNAVLQEESDKGENLIIEELQKGYILNGKVIRHSMVKVSK